MGSKEAFESIMKKVIVLILTIVFFIPVLKAENITSYRTLGDLERALAQAEEEKIAQENEKQLTEAEYNKLAQDIATSEAKVQTLNKEIIDANNRITELGVEIEDKKEETNNILVFLQLSNGEKMYLEYIFEAKSFTDFIHRVSIVEQISKYNKEQIKKMNELIKELEALKIENANNIKEQESLQAELQEKRSQVGSRLSQLYDGALKIDDKINELREQIELMHDNGCYDSSSQILACLGVPMSTGFIRPFAVGIVTDVFGFRTAPLYGMHSGVDLGTHTPAEGTPIYPVAPGVVASKVYYNSCGGNQMYIYHNINGESYTSLYMHMLNFNEDIQEGDIVTTDTVIGYMGGWSTSAQNGGYDTCAFGAHLHLTLAYGHTLDHYSALIDPETLIYFPDGWWYSRTW